MHAVACEYLVQGWKRYSWLRLTVDSVPVVWEARFFFILGWDGGTVGSLENDNSVPMNKLASSCIDAMEPCMLPSQHMHAFNLHAACKAWLPHSLHSKDFDWPRWLHASLLAAFSCAWTDTTMRHPFPTFFKNVRRHIKKNGGSSSLDARTPYIMGTYLVQALLLFVYAFALNKQSVHEA